MRPYGLRVLRAAFIGLILTLLFYGIAFVISEYLFNESGHTLYIIIGSQVELRIAFWGYSLAALSALIFYRANISTRTIFSLLFAGLTIYTVFYMPGPFLLEVAKLILLQLEETPTNYQYLQAFIVYFIFPLLLNFGPPFAVYKLERMRERPTFRRWFVYGKGGSSRWAGPKTYDKRQHGLKGLGTPSASIQTDRIFLGRTLLDDDPRMKLISIKDDSHMLTIGMTGSGKSTTVLYPNLAMYSGSVIVLDPKGEHAMQTYRRRSSKAWLYEVGIIGNTEKHFPQGRAFVLDPFKETKGFPYSSFNPLLEINITSDRCREMIAAIADGCIPGEGDRNRHFTENAKLFLEGVIAHVLSKHPPEHHNLPYLLDLFLGINQEGRADPEALNELLIRMRLNDAAGRLPQHAAATLDGMGDRERGSVLSTLSRSLKWAGDPAMRKHLVTSDLSFWEIGTNSIKPDTVYIVLPDGLIESQMRWLRVLVGVVIVAQRNRKSKPDTPTLFILDEFPRLGGNIEAVEHGIVTLRSAKVKLWPFIQNIGQLERDYPKSWRVFAGRANVQIFGVSYGDDQTAEWISSVLGSAVYEKTKRKWYWPFKKTTISTRNNQLYTASEVTQELGKTANMQIVLPSSGFPMRLERLAYKPMTVEGDSFRSLDEWKGHFEDW